MPSASTVRLRIESILAQKIPSALTPAPKMIRPVAATGIDALDELLNGGLPIGAISELVGPECSGRTSTALSFLSRITQESKVCAWVDVSNCFAPASAAASGIDLTRLLWIRCGARSSGSVSPGSKSAWSKLEQALRTTDLLLQGGGFGAIVLDMGSVAPEFVSRVPLATWFRYRAAAERTQSSILLLTQHACAKSSAELMLRFLPADVLCDEATILTGLEHRVEVARRRFTQIESNVVPMRKPPRRATVTSWQSRTTWAGRNEQT